MASGAGASSPELLLKTHHGSEETLSDDEPQPKPKPPSTDPQSSVGAPTGKPGDVLVMPDGSMVSMQGRASGVPPRSDVSSIEHPASQLTMPAPSAATDSPAFNSLQEGRLPSKHAANPVPGPAPGPAPGSGPPTHYSYPPQANASLPSYHINAIPPKPGQFGDATGPAPEPGAQLNFAQPPYQVPPSQPQSSLSFTSHAPVPGPAPDHVPLKGAAPSGPAPVGRQVPPVQRNQPAPLPPQPPTHMYRQPTQYQSFPPNQYQPYQPPTSGQYTTPYAAYQQPNPTPRRKPVKTSKTFNSDTLGDNQYYFSICLCITLTLLCNPLSLICCIPAFYFASRAADENEKGNYEQALSNHKKAQYLNAGGFINIMLGGIIFLIIITISFSLASALLNSSSSTA